MVYVHSIMNTPGITLNDKMVMTDQRMIANESSKDSVGQCGKQVLCTTALIHRPMSGTCTDEHEYPTTAAFSSDKMALPSQNNAIQNSTNDSVQLCGEMIKHESPIPNARTYKDNTYPITTALSKDTMTFTYQSNSVQDSTNEVVGMCEEMMKFEGKVNKPLSMTSAQVDHGSVVTTAISNEMVAAHSTKDTFSDKVMPLLSNALFKEEPSQVMKLKEPVMKQKLNVHSAIAQSNVENDEDNSQIVKTEPSDMPQYSMERQTYQCELCGEVYFESSALKSHAQSHLGQKLLTCVCCQLLFFDVTSLAEHVRTNHFAVPLCLKCPVCLIPFTKPTALTKHLRIHTGEESSKCRVCFEVFPTDESLSHHMKNAHPGLGPSPACAICNAQFSNSSKLQRHMLTHTSGKYFVCRECGDSFDSSKDLERHLYTHLGADPDQPFKCNFCSHEFARLDLLNLHKQSAHKVPMPINAKGIEKDNKMSSKKQDGKLKIPCVITIPILYNSADDKLAAEDAGDDKDIDKSKSNTNNVNYAKNESDEPLARNEAKPQDQNPSIKPLMPPQEKPSGKKPIVCALCMKEFSDGSSLRKHMFTHTGEKPFKCSYCTKVFSRVDTLKDHVRSHTGEKPFKCTICPAAFAIKKTLQYHLKKHSGEKPFKCDVCGMSFMLAAVLRQHKMTHTGVKPFLCTECGASFRASSDLNNHRRVHTGEKPFQCEFCAKCFASQNTLRNHRRTHTGEKPFLCSQCPSAFPQVGQLNSHMLIHTGEKPHPCQVCNKRFRTSGQLKVHSQLHTGVKRYKCRICSGTFSDSGNLRKHMRSTHSGVEPYGCAVCTATFPFVRELNEHMEIHKEEDVSASHLTSQTPGCKPICLM